MSNWGFKGGIHDTVMSPENVTVVQFLLYMKGYTVYIIIAGYFRMVEMFVYLMMKTTISVKTKKSSRHKMLQREHRFYRTRNECIDSALTITYNFVSWA